MKKGIGLLVIIVFFFGFFTYSAFAELRMTTPSSVVETDTRELAPTLIENSLGNINVYYPGIVPAVSSSTFFLMNSTYDSASGSFGTPSRLMAGGSAVGGVLEVAGTNASNNTEHLIITKAKRGLIPAQYQLFWTKNSGAGWESISELASSQTSTSESDIHPSVAETANGDLMVVFAREEYYDVNGNKVSGPDGVDPNYHFSGSDLYFMTYSASTGTWTAPSAIDTTVYLAESYPSLTQGPNGKIFMVYSNNDNGTWNVLFRVYENGVWGAPKVLDSGVMAEYFQQASIINDMPGKYRLVYASKKFCYDDLCPGNYSEQSSEIVYRTYDSTIDIWSDNVVKVTDRNNFYADLPSALHSSDGKYWLAFRRIDPSITKSLGTSNYTTNTDIYWIKSTPNTPVGENILVDLGSNSSITFANVTQAGDSTLDTSTTPPHNHEGAFQVGDVYYDISTNAVFSGPLDIVINYSDSGVTVEEEANLRLMHYNSDTSSWEDATTNLDTVNNKIYGTVTSLSWFSLMTKNQLTWLAPMKTVDEGQAYTFNDGSTLPIKFTLKDANGKFVNENLKVIVKDLNGNVVAEFLPGEGTDQIRYDSVTGEYIVNFHTKNYSLVLNQDYIIEVFGSQGSYSSTLFQVLEGGKAQGKK